ncbi:sulfur transfer protein [Longilinea arvoryzae]|uniref:Sulfur transfer protein n=1 Tax=Longilinea arvoryzae TaxID=360412 RepID=A0A0S7BL63_9CHLR|nr:MoaD/ThiS family protein [Longilinea arvoryzae]GAP15824.1 sulfur transfer protein [Longilinea arvoryzae]
MRIRVILYSYLREKLPVESNGRVELELPEGSPAAALFEQLGLPGQVAWAVNGIARRDFNLILHDGDEVRVFRPGAGG